MSTRGNAESYYCFVRDWWRWERGKLVPNSGARKHTLATHMTYDEAREFCQEYNRTHEPGPLSRKAEFDEE